MSECHFYTVSAGSMALCEYILVFDEDPDMIAYWAFIIHSLGYVLVLNGTHSLLLRLYLLVKKKAKETKMNCPPCLNSISPGTNHQELMFEICCHCGTVVLDFGAQRPALYQALEKQIDRWDHALKTRIGKRQMPRIQSELAG